MPLMSPASRRVRPARRPVVADDLFRLSFIQGAALSPDGETVVYAASRMAKDDEREFIALRRVDLKSGVERPLGASSARDFNPRFSPDGGRVAFLSTCGGLPQVYVVATKGGKARRLTAAPQGVGGGPVWSPDGRWLAFTAGPPGAKRDPAGAYRVTRHIHRFDDMGNLDDAVQDIYIVPAAGGPARRLTGDGGHCANPAWSPDGREILFTSHMRRDSLSVLLGSLKIVDRKGSVRDITGAWGHALSAAWLPDGRVVFCGQRRGRPIGSKADVWVIDRKGGAPKCRTTGITFHVGGGLQPDMATGLMALPRVVPAEDGGAAFVQVQDGGAVRIYRVALAGPENCTAVIGGERACFPLDLRSGRLLFAASAWDNPLDLFTAAPDGSSERRITSVNADAMRAWRLPVIERLGFKGGDGAPVEGWIMKPSAGAGPFPSILYIHGGPHSAFGHIFSFDFHMLAGAGYAVILLNQRGSTGYGDAFATRIIGDWGNLDYRDLIAGVDAAVARGLADPERLGVCGISGGGNLTCWIVGQTGRFKAAVPENPVTNWVSFYGVSDIGPWFAVEELGGRPHEIPEVYRRCSPITYAHRCVTPTLLIQGEADWRCPPEQSEQFYAVLKASGCAVEMLRLPGGAHAASIRGKPLLRRAQNEALLEWMNRHVLAKRAKAKR